MISFTADKSVHFKEFSLTKRDFWHFIYSFHKEMGQIKLIHLKESQVLGTACTYWYLCVQHFTFEKTEGKAKWWAWLSWSQCRSLKGSLLSYFSLNLLNDGYFKIIFHMDPLIFFSTSTYYIGTSVSILWGTLLITEKDSCICTGFFCSSHNRGLLNQIKTLAHHILQPAPCPSFYTRIFKKQGKIP